MLHRIFSLTMLLTSLFFAGLPTFAYAECVPTYDCCRSGPLAPCSVEGSAAAPSDDVQRCCAVSPTAPAVFAVSASSNEFHKHVKRSDVPAILIPPAISPTVYVESSRSAAISTASSFSTSYPLIYLITRRLRL